MTKPTTSTATAIFQYDNLNRLTLIEHKDGTNAVQRFAYVLDDNGNVESVTDVGGSSWDYEYDERNRLELAVRYHASAVEEYREAYTYDDGDNMLTKIVTVAGQSPITTTFTPNNANELTGQSGGGENFTYTYDAAGRQTTKSDGTYTTTNSWRYGNLLHEVEASDPNVADVTYEYGGNGIKRSRTAGTEYEWYNWSGLQLIQAEDDLGALTETYVHHPFRIWGAALASIGGNTPGGGTARYITHDLLGSTRAHWDGSKASLGAWEPTPFGETYASTLPTDVLHQFTGQVYDPATQLNYFAFRHYAPGQVRWLSPEPFGLDGPNLFWYAGNNPVTNADFHGLWIHVVWGAEVGGLIGYMGAPAGSEWTHAAAGALIGAATGGMNLTVARAVANPTFRLKPAAAKWLNRHNSAVGGLALGGLSGLPNPLGIPGALGIGAGRAYCKLDGMFPYEPGGGEGGDGSIPRNAFEGLKDLIDGDHNNY